MKILYLFLLITFSTLYTQAQNQPFITTWEVNANQSIQIPTTGSGYNYSIDFGDGTILNNQTGNINHTYSSAGTYTVSITGAFPRIYFANTNSFYTDKLLSIDQWGDILWESMHKAFQGCENLVVNAIDSPDLSQVTDLSYMFKGAISLNQSIDHWDVSNVTDMSNMFEGALLFNQALNNWDVSSVTNMTRMFNSANGFNQPIGNWNVMNVIDVSRMFENAYNFNQFIGDWDVSNVSNMEGMFSLADQFDIDLSNWDVSSVTNMKEMFANARKFNQPIGNWDVSNVTDMSQMFKETPFNQPIENWDVSNVTNMGGMFSNNDKFNQSLNNWDVSNVSNLGGMFYYARSFNQPLSDWVISNGTNTTNMFNYATNFNQNLTGWNPEIASSYNIIANSGLDTNNYEALLLYFDSLDINDESFEADDLLYCDGTYRTNLINKGWNFSNDNRLINCNSNYPENNFVFRWEIYASNLTLNIPVSGSGFNYNIDFGDDTVVNNLTGDATHTYATPGVYELSISGTYPNLNMCPLSVEQWGDIQWQNLSYSFSSPNTLSSCDTKINATDTPNLTQVNDISYMFDSQVEINVSLDDWDVSNVTNMEGLFYGNSYNRDLNNWDVSNVTNMKALFMYAYFDKPIDNWDVSNVTNMSEMFSYNNYFNQNINDWDVSNVNNMSEMFNHNYHFNQNINNWNVSNVTNMSKMFLDAEKFNQPLNNWEVTNVSSLESMFSEARSFNQPLNNWDVSSVTNMTRMFSNATNFNQPIDNWNVSSVINMEGLFYSAQIFNQNINGWNVSNVTNMEDMFGLALSYNKPLNNWDVNNVLTMKDMFYITPTFNQDLSDWNFNSNITLGMNNNYTGFLYNSNLDIVNYEKLLNRFAMLNLNNKILGAHNTEYCNSSIRDYLINSLGWTILGDVQATNCNSIIGIITLDENNNGCDPNDAAISGFMVNANDGSDDFLSYSINGNYELGTVGTNFTVSVVNYPSYFSVSPASQQVTFTTSNTEVADFCVTSNQTMEDLNVVLIPTSEARPGFEADYQLVVENIGTQTLANATATLDFDDAMQSFVSASVTPTFATANQLTFDIANLQPLTFQTVGITMQTFQPPTVNGDDILSFTANVSPSANDFTPNDNTFLYNQTVVNSYDPNDKQVLQGEEIDIDDADEYLNYLIRFQNTGTASAINVRILDTLHPKLDYSTLRPVNSSHNYRIEINNENEVEFIFDGINLPDENTNEPASHGFVTYKIKPKSDVAVGDFITGDANIYFDFNAPIITNMVSTEIIDDLSSTSYTLENDISIYPNPTQNILNIETKNNQEIEKLKIYNLSGLDLINIEENKKQINLENLSTGVYFLQIQTNLGTVNKRFIKK